MLAKSKEIIAMTYKMKCKNIEKHLRYGREYAIINKVLYLVCTCIPRRLTQYETL